MLILTRKIGESIVIGDAVRVRVLSIDQNRMRIGITAPPEVRILRGELVAAAAAGPPPDADSPAAGGVIS